MARTWKSMGLLVALYPGSGPHAQHPGLSKHLRKAHWRFSGFRSKPAYCFSIFPQIINVRTLPKKKKKKETEMKYIHQRKQGPKSFDTSSTHLLRMPRCYFHRMRVRGIGEQASGNVLVRRLLPMKLETRFVSFSFTMKGRAESDLDSRCVRQHKRGSHIRIYHYLENSVSALNASKHIQCCCWLRTEEIISRPKVAYATEWRFLCLLRFQYQPWNLRSCPSMNNAPLPGLM